MAKLDITICDIKFGVAFATNLLHLPKWQAKKNRKNKENPLDFDEITDIPKAAK